MAKNPKTAEDFEALVAQDRMDGGAAIPSDVIAVVCETKGKRFRLIGKTRSGADKRLSTWQPSEEYAVHDAIARAFC